MVVLSQGHRRRRPSALRHCRYPVRIWWIGGWPGHAADASGDERSLARHAQVPSRGHRNAVDVPSGGPHAPGVDHARLASYRPSMSATRRASATTAADGRLRRGPLCSPPRPSSPSDRGAPRRARGATPPGSCRSRRGRRRGIPVVSQPTLESGAVESRVPLRVRGLTLVDDYVDPPLVQRRVQLRTVASRHAGGQRDADQHRDDRGHGRSRPLAPSTTWSRSQQTTRSHESAAPTEARGVPSSNA
jgi:hypothetical protein